MTDRDDAPAESCCRTDADARIARYFDRRNQRRRSGRERYAIGTATRWLLDTLTDLGPQGHSVLEGGSGPGALLIGLLSAGASAGTGIDLSAEAIEYARERADAAGVADRANFIVGDAATVPAEPHDWVVLDKVICCYPDANGLLRRTIAEARSVFAFAVPVSYGWRGLLARLLFGAEALVLKLLRRPCPAYLHDVRGIEKRLRDAGFGDIRSQRLGIWHAAVFARA